MTDWRNRIVGTDVIDPGALVPNPKNYRRHPNRQVSALEGSLDEIGWIAPVTVNRTTGKMLDGHARVELALRQGVSQVPVQYVDLDEHEEALALATLDPIGAMATHDVEALDALLQEVNTGSDALQALLDEMAEDAGLYQPPEVTEDEAPVDRAEELRQKWGVESGQVWRLGEHRIICGDCTDVAVVERVMAGEKASLVFTDPPYGVAIGAKNRLLNSVQKAGRNLTDIEDDSLSPDDLKAQLLPAFRNIRETVMADDCTVFVTAPQNGELGMMMMMMMREAGLLVRHVLIWKKNQPTFSLGHLDYDYQHEPILLTWGKRHKRPMRGKHRTSVWEIDRPQANKEHPTMKPVELVVNALLNNSDAGDVAFDAYSGSGTTLIACEQLGRKCRAIEISPGYVAVAIERWATLTGCEPELVT
jgi:DNA modification methylase